MRVRSRRAGVALGLTVACVLLATSVQGAAPSAQDGRTTPDCRDGLIEARTTDALSFHPF